MKLSIIIVNYNVACFLEQCLQSVYTALKNIDSELFVVDNNSVDNSVEMLRAKFPQVYLICNKENVGFAKANNQAIDLATGDYILLLNPDTVVEADTFEKVIAFMDNTPDAGGLGVKMVDGRGEYLPESKRGLPVPSVAFYKMFGLSKLFKKSKRFGKYHLTYLDPNEIHRVEVLSGACMFLRKSLLDTIGLLDEDYFMYGEDIDLSYRISKAGFQNYYFPLTRIIHYKGESTKKGSLNYVFVFYRAMQIFARKHFSHKNAGLFNAMINFAILLRASIAVMRRLIATIAIPFLDFILIYAGLFGLALYWEHSILMMRDSAFSDVFLYIMLPLYALVWTLSIYFGNGYKKPVSISKVNYSIIGGTIFILLVYSLLNEAFRFSRAMIILGSVWTFICTNILRYIIEKLNLKNYPVGQRNNARILIIGDEQETHRVSMLMNMTFLKSEFVGFINYQPFALKNPYFVGDISHLKDIITIYQIGEVVFCGKNITAKEIIDIMDELQDMALEYKIAPTESTYVIGSNSINAAGDIYMLHINSIGKKENLRKKRVFDIAVSILFFFFFPVLLWFTQRKRMFFRNIVFVFSGKKTWVSYYPAKDDMQSGSFPTLKKGVLFPTDSLNLQQYNDEIIQQVNNVYARDYKLIQDLNIIMKGFFHLGR